MSLYYHTYIQWLLTKRSSLTGIYFNYTDIKILGKLGDRRENDKKSKNEFKAHTTKLNKCGQNALTTTKSDNILQSDKKQTTNT